MAFIYRPDNGVTLSPSQEEFLESIENKPSPFQGLTSLKDLRSLTGLSVVVTDRERLGEILFNAIKATYRKIAEDHRASNLAEKDIHDRQIWIEEHLNPEKSRFILGLYSRKLFWFDGDAPKVYLFADNIEACASKKGYSEEHVFGFVFIHEMMHAYYDAFNSAGFPAKEPLEEAFAEYGMLTFINKTIGPGVFLEEAKASVFSKIDYGPREYGFGYELFADTSGGAPEMIERYRLVSNWIDYPTVSRFAKDYFKCIEDYKKSTDEKTASDCIEGVRYILGHEWPEPDAGYIIQPGIGKKVPALSLPGISSAVPPTGLAGSKISVPKSRHYFDIKERKTGTYIARHESMRRCPLDVVNHFCNRNYGITYDGLDLIFNRNVKLSNMPLGLKNMIERESSVAAYVATLKPTPGESPKPRFHVGEPICLIGGDKIVVTTEWRYNSCFQDFWKLADILGYDMIEVV